MSNTLVFDPSIHTSPFDQDQFYESLEHVPNGTVIFDRSSKAPFDQDHIPKTEEDVKPDNVYPIGTSFVPDRNAPNKFNYTTGEFVAHPASRFSSLVEALIDIDDSDPENPGRQTIKKAMVLGAAALATLTASGAAVKIVEATRVPDAVIEEFIETVVAPDGLTPEQQIQHQDVYLTTINQKNIEFEEMN